jgi:hypothetical protein
MCDHAWKNAFGADLDGSMNFAPVNAANGAGSMFGSNAVDFGDITTGNITLGSGNTGNTTFGDVTVDASHDLNFFFGSSPLFPTVA